MLSHVTPAEMSLQHAHKLPASVHTWLDAHMPVRCVHGEGETTQEGKVKVVERSLGGGR